MLSENCISIKLDGAGVGGGGQVEGEENIHMKLPFVCLVNRLVKNPIPLNYKYKNIFFFFTVQKYPSFLRSQADMNPV